MNVNKVILVGNITRDPELKTVPSGQQVCSFSLATNEVFVSNGQKQERAEFHNIVAWGKTAENIGRYMRKGSQIYIEGKLQTRSWDKDGVKHYRTEVVALNVQFGAKPKNATADNYDQGAGYEDQGQPPVGAEDEIRVEDIPF